MKAWPGNIIKNFQVFFNVGHTPMSSLQGQTILYQMKGLARTKPITK